MALSGVRSSWDMQGRSGEGWNWLKVRHEGRFIVGGVMRSASNVTGPLVGVRERWACASYVALR